MTKEQFFRAAVKLGIVRPDAIDDPEGYDSGFTRDKLAALWEEACKRMSADEPRPSHIKTWRERCDELHDDMVIVTSNMVQQRMQEEIDDLRAALNRGDVG